MSQNEEKVYWTAGFRATQKLYELGYEWDGNGWVVVEDRRPAVKSYSGGVPNYTTPMDQAKEN
jgi:hypothetical protein